MLSSTSTPRSRATDARPIAPFAPLTIPASSASPELRAIYGLLRRGPVLDHMRTPHGRSTA
eukprot:13302290-Alexandrium_andersonii.AAC.1